jgi:hypothetical protein
VPNWQLPSGETLASRVTMGDLDGGGAQVRVSENDVPLPPASLQPVPSLRTTVSLLFSWQWASAGNHHVAKRAT